MKKLFALLLTLMLLCSMASMVFAADFSYAMGGHFYGYATTIDDDRGLNASPGTDCWDTILGATVKQGNTWVRISYIASSWEQTINHALGIDNIGGTPLSLGFDTHDTGTANAGQAFMGDFFNEVKGDPTFNTCDMAGSINAKYITDSFEFRAEAKVYDGSGYTFTSKSITDDAGKTTDYADSYKEKFATTLVFKNGNNNFHFGAKHTAGVEDEFFVVGADLKLGQIGLKVDLWSDPSNQGGLGEVSGLIAGGGYTALQATANIGKLTGQFAYVQPEANWDDAIGFGAAYQLTEKVTLSGKYFMVDDKLTPDNLYDMYAMYKVGAWDVRLGTSNVQHNSNGGSNNKDYKAGFGSSLYEDGYMYAGVHFEF